MYLEVKGKMPFDGHLIIRSKNPMELLLTDDASNIADRKKFLDVGYRPNNNKVLAECYTLKKDSGFIASAYADSIMVEAIGFSGEKYVFSTYY